MGGANSTSNQVASFTHNGHMKDCISLCNGCAGLSKVTRDMDSQSLESPVDLSKPITIDEEIKDANQVNNRPMESIEVKTDSQSTDGDMQEPRLTLEQLLLLQKSWAMLRDHMEDIGLQLFLKIFETYPDVQRLFWPRYSSYTEAELLQSPELRSHGRNIMKVLDLVLDGVTKASQNGVREVEAITRFLHDLGRKHITYRAQPIYFDLVCPFFLAVIEPYHRNDETTDIAKLEQAWFLLLQLIVNTLREAMTM